MNQHPQQLLEPQTRPPQEAWMRDRMWTGALAILVAILLLQVLSYSDTVASMVSIWNRSETYTHGWIIGPISGYLIWLRRNELARLVPQPSMLGALVWAALNLCWLAGHLAGALVVSQYAFVAMIPALVWALLGQAVAGAIAFPLFFLLLMVPSGEAMVPAMIDFTANFTVKMLQLTGIPVYREGTYFSVPSGDWNVVEACSGIRYLIASFTGGCLFAYLYYRTAWKRAAVILASIVIPILANGFRAYMIVMIGHLSDMRLAVGVDHFIYGWVFFGIVMFGLFWVAALWRESEADDAVSVTVQVISRRPTIRNVLIMAAIVCGTGALWRFYIEELNARSRATSEVTLQEVLPTPKWSRADGSLTNWAPHYSGFDKSLTQTFRAPDGLVQLNLMYYRGQSQGKELISSTNLILGPNSDSWRVIGQRTRPELNEGGVLRETELRDGNRHLLVWDWYRIDDQDFSNMFIGKWLLAKDRFLGGTGEGAAVFISTPYEVQPEPAREKLRRFMADMYPGIRSTLDRTGGR